MTARHQWETMELALPFLKAWLSQEPSQSRMSPFPHGLHAGSLPVAEGCKTCAGRAPPPVQKCSTTGAKKCCTTGQCVYAVPFQAAVSPQSPAQGWSSSKVSSFALTRTW